MALLETLRNYAGFSAVLMMMNQTAYGADPSPFKTDANTVALWVLDQPTGSSIPDLADFGGTIQPKLDAAEVTETPPESVAGKYGKALKFSGTSSLIGTSHRQLETPAAVTLEIWFKLDPEGEETERGLFENMNSDGGGYRMIVMSNGYLNWQVPNAAGEQSVLRSNLKLPVDEWIHIAATYDGTNMRLYIDGKMDGEMELADGNPQGGGKPLVGFFRAGTLPYFRGIIEAVRISDIARSEFPAP